MNKIGATLGAIALAAALATAGCGSTDNPVAVPADTTAPATPAHTQQPRATRPAANPAPAGPATSFGGDGTYVVGDDITPGTYHSSGPSDSFECYWARLSDLNGGLESIIANHLGSGPSVMAVQPTDAAVEVTGCARWTRTGDAPAPQQRQSPPVPAEPPGAPATGSGTDEYYRNLLRADGVFFPSDTDAVAEGHHACALYSDGADNNAVTQQIMQDYPDLSQTDAMDVGHAATLAYCPQYS